VAKRIAAALRAHQKKGDYNSLTDGDSFAKQLTVHLREVSHDKHMGVNFSPSLLPADLSKPDPEAMARNRKGVEQANCYFRKVEILQHNVGYLKLDAFADPVMCGVTASAAMNFLRNVAALVVDLRENQGGRPEMVAFLCTYLFAQPTHLNDLWTRKGDTTQQYWTLPYVPGKRLAEQPVYVLTSRDTFSGGEEFTYDLKNLKRATIVGETTGGGAHPVSGHTVDGHFAVLVPFARAINPISRTNWEGVGVEPDVKVPASDALATAEKLAAERLSAQ
jgi:C-terminal processing protease CtpA/Prc